MTNLLFSLLLLPLAVAVEESTKGLKVKESRRSLSVFIFQAEQSLSMTIYWRKIPPEPGPATINAPGRQSVGVGGGILLGKESICVCSSFFSKAVKPAPKCQIACQHASLCHPSLSQTKAPSELRCVAMRMGKWWCVINGKELSDSAGEQTTSGTLTATCGWSWGVNGSSLMWTKIFHLKSIKWHSTGLWSQVHFWKPPKIHSRFQLVKNGSKSAPLAL